MNKLHNDREYDQLPPSVELEVMKELHIIEEDEKQAEQIDSQYDRYIFSKWIFENLINLLHA